MLVFLHQFQNFEIFADHKRIAVSLMGYQAMTAVLYGAFNVFEIAATLFPQYI